MFWKGIGLFMSFGQLKHMSLFRFFSFWGCWCEGVRRYDWFWGLMVSCAKLCMQVFWYIVYILMIIIDIDGNDTLGRFWWERYILYILCWWIQIHMIYIFYTVLDGMISFSIICGVFYEMCRSGWWRFKFII